MNIIEAPSAHDLSGPHFRPTLPRSGASREVGAEFVGRARTFRRAMTAADDIAVPVIDRLTARLLARHRRNPTPRPAMLIDVTRDWHALVPAAGRVALSIEQSNKALRIVELRAQSAKFRFVDWAADAAERGVAVFAFELVTSPWQFYFDARPIASISLHALARRIQRSFDATDAGMLADMRSLAMQYDDLTRQGGDFAVAAGDGRWVGCVTEIEDRGSPALILAVRSFISAEMFTFTSKTQGRN
jgi:hypothetical protein